MSIRSQLTALAILVLLPLAALAADISGTWGKSMWATGESELVGGKVDGDTVSFVENFIYEGNKVAITYTGKVISADEIQFSRAVSGMAHEELVAKRAT